MVLRHGGNNVSQGEIANWALSRTDCDGSVPATDCNVTIPISGAADARRDLVSALEHFGIAAEFSDVVPSADKVTSRLEHGPIATLLAGAGGSAGHFVLLVGWHPSDDESDPVLLLNDPLSQPPRQASVGYIEFRAGSIPGLAGWSQSVFVAQDN
jgi:hypothetical protein